MCKHINKNNLPGKNLPVSKEKVSKEINCYRYKGCQHLHKTCHKKFDIFCVLSVCKEGFICIGNVGASQQSPHTISTVAPWLFGPFAVGTWLVSMAFLAGWTLNYLKTAVRHEAKQAKPTSHSKVLSFATHVLALLSLLKITAIGAAHPNPQPMQRMTSPVPQWNPTLSREPRSHHWEKQRLGGGDVRVAESLSRLAPSNLAF